MNNRAIAIQAMGLSKTLGDQPVLAGVDLAVVEGETIAITGANGAGKTTLLRCLAGLSRPANGEVRWFGHPAAACAADRRLIGMATHDSLLYPALTIRENLIFAARMYDVPHPGRLADELVRRAGLGPHADVPSARLSQGLRRRVAVLRVMLHEPPILLLDEPFAGLDALGGQWVCELLADLRGQGRTVCFTTHEPRSAADLADRIVLLRAGRLEELGAKRKAESEKPKAEVEAHTPLSAFGFPPFSPRMPHASSPSP